MLCFVVQVGSFYEAAGIDAILLHQYSNLNFMGKGWEDGAPAKAGVNVAGLDNVLRQLVSEQGLEVVSDPTHPMSV